MTLALILALVFVVAGLAASMKVASEHERAVIFRLGRLLPELRGPGLFLVIPLVDRMIRVDLRTQTVADAVGADHWLLGKEGVVDPDGRVLIDGQPWRARWPSHSSLDSGTRVRVDRLEDDLRLVVGSVTSPTEEGST